MNRLPKRFEDEVLSKHMIEWYASRERYAQYIDGNYYNSSPYTIAAIGLEAMGKESFELYTAGVGKDNMEDGYAVTYCEETKEREFETTVEDKDFCTCIFKAIKEIYG